MSLRHRHRAPFTVRFSDETWRGMELWTRANDSSLAALVRRAVAEFLDRQSLADLGIDIDGLGLGARLTRQLKKLDL